MGSTEYIPNRLPKEIQDMISADLGLPFEDIAAMSPDESAALVRKKLGRDPVYSKERDFRRIGRGNPLISRKKLKTLGDLENNKAAFKWIDKVLGRKHGTA
ncbi:MAG: hypothetical protein LBM41_04975 [Ruminococcus sp.]|jgi:hypothetical protein|nr:hypothetical protein [Ruminococcus sp.]